MYQGRNKQQWATLQSKIRQRMATQNILYLEDQAEMTRRTAPPAPAVTLHAPANRIESASDKDDRIRRQKLNDDDFKKRDGKFDEYRDKLAIDYPKATACHYHHLSRHIITDLDRWIENLVPTTTDVGIQYRAMVKRLLDNWGPTSEKDAEEGRRKFASIAVDTYGADVFLAAADSIVDNLKKTLVRDSANNPVMEPVPLRPHLPRPPWHARLTELVAYIKADEADELAWATLHPPNTPMNHRPTDNAIKNTIIIALGNSSFTSYSSLAQRYQQVDHATKTWPELRQDIESLIHNNPKGTSREPSSLPRPHQQSNPTDWSSHRRRRYPETTDSRSARSEYNDQYDDETNDYPRQDRRSPPTSFQQPQQPHDIRAATPTTLPSAMTTQRFPCANCGADHKSTDCDSTTCTTCQATFPTAALRQAHYIAHHKRDNPNKRTRFNTTQPNRTQYTPPTSPFLSRSARSTDDMTAQSPYDSGYDSSYSTSSGPGNPPPPIYDYPDVSDQADHMVYNAFVATIVHTPEHSPPEATQPATLRAHGQSSNQEAAATRRRLYAHLDAATARNDHSNQIQSLARMIYYARTHPVLTITQPTNSASSDDNDTPPLADDSDDDDDDIPPLMNLSDDSEQEDDTPPDRPATPTDDELNRRGRYATQRTHPMQLPAYLQDTYDVRVATRVNGASDSSDEEAPTRPTSPNYWPIPENHQPPPPADPSDDQIQAWITSQQPWSTYRHRLPILQCLAYGHRPPPAITRQQPNITYMRHIYHTTTDNVHISERLSDFRSSGHTTWTDYLDTTSHRIRRAYLDQPPNQGDFQPTATSALHVPDYDNNGTQAPYYEPKDPAQPHPDDQKPNRLGGYTPHHRHASDIIYRQQGRSILSNSRSPSPKPPDSPASRPASTTIPFRAEAPTHPTPSKSHFVSGIVPPGTIRLRSILTDLRKSKTPPTTNPPNTSSLGGYYTGRPNDHLPNQTHSSARPFSTTLPPRTQTAMIDTWQDVIPDLPSARPRHVPANLRSPADDPTRTARSQFLNRHNNTDVHTPRAAKRPRDDAAETPTPRRPYVFKEPPSDEEGTPWCECCTAQLSDSDPTPGITNPDSAPGTRYRIRHDDDEPPTHSNQHLDYMRIFRTNADANARQRHDWERIEARDGSPLDTHRATSMYTNTYDVYDLTYAISRLQFERYQRRGGRLPRGDHNREHRFNSPNIRNMTPGHPYRTWFHATISRQHYSLGEANRNHTKWLNDPLHGRDRRGDHVRNTDHFQHHARIPTPNQLTPHPDPSESDHSDHSDDSGSTTSLPDTKQHPENRAQTIVEDVHLSPDDPNAVIDSGAMMTTSPRRLLMGTIWQHNIRPAPPGTSIRYGNMETEPVEEVAHIGSYPTSIVPDRFSTALVCVHDIVTAGHNVTFTNTDAIIEDIGSAYTLRTPRNPASREWRVPLNILQRLTDLRAAHPLHHAQPHNPNLPHI